MRKLLITIAVLAGVLTPGVLTTGVAYADAPPCPASWQDYSFLGFCLKPSPGQGQPQGNTGGGFNVKGTNGSGY
jgi:hypothetical protein